MQPECDRATTGFTSLIFKIAQARTKINISFAIHAKNAWLLTGMKPLMPRLCLYCSAQERRAEEKGSADEEFYSVSLVRIPTILCPAFFVKQTLEKTHDYHCSDLSPQGLACLSPECRDSVPPV
jgi:hypothetical protein